MKTPLLCTVLTCILTLGTLSFAHSSLVSSSPKDDSTVKERPTQISMTFSEEVEPQFSTFVVYPLGQEKDHEALEEKADTLLPQVLSKPDGNQVNAKLTTQEASDTITLALPKDLKPGSYAVMWRALSVDTHTVQDLMVFTYQP